MVIGHYLRWVEGAPVQARIVAVRALVDAYTRSEIDDDDKHDAELALFALLDDQSAAVRRALAEAVAHSMDAPRHLIVALASDQSVVSVPVLRHSPLLGDADLVDAVAIGDSASQTAVAKRPSVHGPVAAALAEVGDRTALLALCGNENADIPPCAARRIMARFGEDGEIREAILARIDLDPVLRHDLVVATARALTSFAMDCNWMSPERADRVKRESHDKATVTIAAISARDDGADGPRRLIAHLRAEGHLTPAVILRSLLSGNVVLFEAALSELSGMSCTRVAGHIRAASGIGFASLYAKAGMPASLLPAFRAALSSRPTHEAADGHRASSLSRPVIVRVLKACAGSTDPELGKVAALLRRFEAEAIRDEAREMAEPAWSNGGTEPPPDTEVPSLKPWMLLSGDIAPKIALRPAA